MPLLDQFKYDVFLSYGWAGLRDVEDGDRAWVATFKRELQAHLSGALGHAARIYLDVEDSQNGELPSRLQEAVTSSAIFLSVISNGSCRSDSWCRTELDIFDDADSLILQGRKQIFSVLLWNVPKQDWPARLQAMTPVPFHNDRGGPVPRTHLTDTSEEPGDKLQTLAIGIAEVLRAIEERTRKAVFVGWTSQSLEPRATRLIREIEARGGFALRPHMRNDETATAFAARVERLVQNASIAVHLVPGTGGSPRDGWPDSIESIQIQATARRFGREHNRRIVWNEPVPGHSQAVAVRTEAQDLHGTGFEYVLDVITECVARYSSAPVAAPPVIGTTRYVFVKCLQQDAARLTPMRQALEARGIHLRLPIFEGDERRRNEVNAELIQRSRGVAVYFGSLNDLEAYDACQTVLSTTQSSDPPVPKAVVLDPDTDPVRQGFWYPDFKSYSASSVERVVEHLLSGRAS